MMRSKSMPSVWPELVEEEPERPRCLPRHRPSISESVWAEILLSDVP